MTETTTEQPTTKELRRRLLETRLASAEMSRRTQELQRDRYEREEAKRQAREALENFTYNLHEAILPHAVGALSAWLEDRALRFPNSKLEVRISSPGGSVFDGLALMDTMKHVRSRGVHLTVVIQGWAASMAGIIAQAADHRIIAKDSYLMIHTVSQGVFGRMETKDFLDEAELCKRLTLHGCEAYAERSGGKWTAQALYEVTLRKDWWLTAAESLAEGFVDEVR